MQFMKKIPLRMPLRRESLRKRKKAKKKIKTEQASESRKEQNKVFAKASYFFVLMFLSLCAYLVYFNIADRETINSSSYNTKQDNKDTMVIRGSIYSSDGELLAVTNVAEDGSESRSYPYGRLFSHVIGYASNGRSGTEATYNTELTSCHASLFEQIKNEAQDVKIQGDSVNLSLDTLLQRAAYDALGNYSGAVVVPGTIYRPGSGYGFQAGFRSCFYFRRLGSFKFRKLRKSASEPGGSGTLSAGVHL